MPGFPTKDLRLLPTAARRPRQSSRTWLPLHKGTPPSARTPLPVIGYQHNHRQALARPTTLVGTRLFHFTGARGTVKDEEREMWKRSDALRTWDAGKGTAHRIAPGCCRPDPLWTLVSRMHTFSPLLDRIVVEGILP